MFLVALSFYSVVVSILLGHLTQKAVGILYVNEAGDKIRVARLSFWGDRTDEMCEIDDIMQFQDQG